MIEGILIPLLGCLYAPPFSNVPWYGIPGALLLGFGLVRTVAVALRTT